MKISLLGWRHPFLWGAGSLVIGILAYELKVFIAIPLLGGILIVMTYLWLRRKVPLFFWMLPAFAVLGYFRAYVQAIPFPNSVEGLQGYLVCLTGYMVEEPLKSRRTFRILMEAESAFVFINRCNRAVRGRVLAYVKDSTVLSLPIGARVSVVLRLDTVRYGKAYWARQGVFVGGFAERVIWRGIEWRYVWGYFARLRMHLIGLMRGTFPREGSELALTYALLLGYRRGLDPETRSSFQLSGTAHILAVSGMHVGLVLSLWLFLLRRLPGHWGHHWISKVLLVSLVVFYGFLTGASPSAMRAVIMGSIALVAQIFYRPYMPLNALGFAGFLQLSLDLSILQDIGFQLSYAAVGGILAFYQPLRQLFPRTKSAWKVYLRDLIAISLAAQAGTFFLSWSHFEKMPIYFLIANVVAVPLATLLAFSAVGWFISLPIPILNTVWGWIVYGLAYALLNVVKMVASMPFASLSLPSLSIGVAILLTLLCVGGGGMLLYNLSEKKVAPWIV
ncbi:MAG: ComEC/Rec2 family competence protein [Bacteroidia bacterium]|nr:ComEC/Rec2 family competence protein [Bacteroidia bacterium]